MYFIYDLLLILFFLLFVPYFLWKMVFAGKYRTGIFQRIGFLPREIEESYKKIKPLWFHAVSVGEVIAVIPLIHKIKEKFPERKIVLSTVTHTGYQVAVARAKGVDDIIFFPFDFSWSVKKAIRSINPQILIITETEIWPNLLRELKRHTVPSIMINGRVSPSSYKRYRLGRFFFKAVLSDISVFCMQSTIDAERIIGIGADPNKVMVSGNIKFDQYIVPISAQDRDELRRSFNLQKNQKVFVAGSTHRGEEGIILDVFKELKNFFPGLLLILAPRHPERFDEVEELIETKGIKAIRKTAIVPTEEKTYCPIVLLDTMGELARTYSIGDIIFVGGSLVNIGGHNLLEPAAYKKPVIFGPFMHNFIDITRYLIDSKGGILVKNKEEFFLWAQKLLKDKQLRNSLGEAAFDVIEKNRGALKKNREVIEKFFRQSGNC